MIKIGATEGAPVTLDPMSLVDTRMLVQANSGGGKSWVLRLVAEQIADKVQTIILDPEGEFATLRERLDIALVGREGEIAADVRSAALLARKLMELQVSAVVDLYDLKLQDRRRYVRLFLESLMGLPRALWRPLLVMLDEAHLFCPERSAGQAESTDAVIALMSQGRKRGYCGILATQRLSKLHKDAEAEANNVLVGRTWLDIDQQRAGDLLGMAKADRRALRELEPGEFFAFGPALSTNGVARLRADHVKTTHPKAGERHKLSVPKPSAALSKIVSQLTDLPEQAEEEARTVETLQRKVAELQRQLNSRQPTTDPAAVERAVTAAVAQRDREWQQNQAAVERQLADTNARLAQIARLASQGGGDEFIEAPVHKALGRVKPAPVVPIRPTAPAANGNLSGGERKILTALAQYPGGRTKRQVAVLTGYAHSGGGFNNYLGGLRSKGYLEGSNDLRITQAGADALGGYDPLPTGAALADHWRGQLGKAEREILDVLLEAYPRALTKQQIAEQTPSRYEASGGGFNNALGKLRTLELAHGRGEIKAADEFFT